jgi:hypothetical protein
MSNLPIFPTEPLLPGEPDQRHFSPPAQRNCQPILSVLSQVLPQQGTVLEVASGSGEHAVFFAPRLPQLLWQPSDLAEENLRSILAWQQAQPAANLLPPLLLDASAADWPIAQAAAIVNINMIHISPWAACLGLLAGAQRILPSGGVLYLYGPYQRGGRHTAPSNAAFSAMLTQQNPAWAVRDLDDVSRAATAHGLTLTAQIEMPANNLSLIFTRG